MFTISGNNLPTLRHTEPIRSDYPGRIAEAIQRELGASRGAAKTLMRWTGVSERTAKNWMAAKRGPSGVDLLCLARHSDEVLRAMLILIGKPTLSTAVGTNQAKLLLVQAIKLLQGDEEH
ncbi:hypothetical protein GCM10027296_43580 [Chitinimonas naiadis]